MRAAPLLALLSALVCAGCGGAAHKGRTVTFAGAGSFPPSTIVGNYSTRGCCTSKELGSAIERGLTPRQRAFLLHNVASDVHRAFQAALDS